MLINKSKMAQHSWRKVNEFTTERRYLENMTMGPFGKTSMKLVWVYLMVNHIKNG